MGFIGEDEEIIGIKLEPLDEPAEVTPGPVRTPERVPAAPDREAVPA